MTRVPPGCETGVYYVVLAGIAWAADWRELKDFVRRNDGGAPIEVDHAEIYKNGGGGWVRLLDLNNFRRTFSELFFVQENSKLTFFRAFKWRFY